MIAVIGLILGIVLGLVFSPDVPPELQPYLPIAVVAALDALFGGIRAQLEGTFVDRVFITSFLSNVLVAALLVFLGDQLGSGRSCPPPSSSCSGSASSPTPPRSGGSSSRHEVTTRR